MYLDVLRGAHTDIESKGVCDIEDLRTDNGAKALSNRGEEVKCLYSTSPEPHLVANG